MTDPSDGDDDRAGHSMALLGGLAVVYGGNRLVPGGPGDEHDDDFNIGLQACGDVHALDLAAGAWVGAEVQGRAPAARYCHACAVVDERTMLVCGGWAFPEERFFNDVALLHLLGGGGGRPPSPAAATFRWSIPCVRGVPPEPRCQASLCTFSVRHSG